MATKKFGIGTVVTKVGSPRKMAIEVLGKKTAACQWFVRETLHCAIFPLSRLREVK